MVNVFIPSLGYRDRAEGLESFCEKRRHKLQTEKIYRQKTERVYK